MMAQLGITKLRPGRNANEGQPNAANYDEALANPYPDLPDVLTLKNGRKVRNADEWNRLRRPEIVERSIRFRTLGCFPLTGAVESEARTLSEVIQEMLLTTTSERQGRVIDRDAGDSSMDKKKQEGYF